MDQMITKGRQQGQQTVALNSLIKLYLLTIGLSSGSPDYIGVPLPDKRDTGIGIYRLISVYIPIPLSPIECKTTKSRNNWLKTGFLVMIVDSDPIIILLRHQLNSLKFVAIIFSSCCQSKTFTDDSRRSLLSKEVSVYYITAAFWYSVCFKLSFSLQ